MSVQLDERSELEHRCMAEHRYFVPAKYHIWYEEQGSEHLTASCDEHLQSWQQRDDIKFDFHPIGDVCGRVNGITWVFSYTSTGDGTCVIDWGQSADFPMNIQAKKLVSV